MFYIRDENGKEEIYINSSRGKTNRILLKQTAGKTFQKKFRFLNVKTKIILVGDRKKSIEKLALESLGTNNLELFLQCYDTLNGAVIPGSPMLIPETKEFHQIKVKLLHSRSFIHSSIHSTNIYFLSICARHCARCCKICSFPSVVFTVLYFHP